MNKDEKTRKILFFSRLNKYFIFPFLVPILNLYPSLVVKYIFKHYDLKNKGYFKSIYICSSLIVGGLFYFVSLVKIRKNEEEIKIKENINASAGHIKLIYNSADNNINHKKKYFFLIIMSLLFSSDVFFNQIYASKYNILDSRFYEILFISNLSKIILKINIFRHQKFSIILAFFGFICIFISIFPEMTKDDILINILSIFKCLAYSIFLVLVKYLTCNYFLSPYLCCLLVGNFSTILLFIFLILHSLSKKSNLSYLSDSLNFSNINNNKSKFYLLLISSFIVYSSTQFFTYMTIYYFSPMVFLMTQIVFPLMIWVINIIQDTSKLFEMIFTGLGYLILLIAILIYHEIIILNFCELNKNTRKFIEEREKSEIISSLDNNEINNSRRYSSFENNEDINKDDISDN